MRLRRIVFVVTVVAVVTVFFTTMVAQTPFTPVASDTETQDVETLRYFARGHNRIADNMAWDGGGNDNIAEPTTYFTRGYNAIADRT